MIVIVIIGVVYTLAITQLKSVDEKSFSPNFLNLKEYLLGFLAENGKSARLLCLDECQKCGVYVDGEKVQTIESFFNEDVALYRYDFLEGMRRVDKGIYFDEEGAQQDVCFSLSVRKNGVAQQLFVLYEEKVYDYTSYFTKTQRYDSLEAAAQAQERLVQKVMH